jgi:dephospho-CoA kinase
MGDNVYINKVLNKTLIAQYLFANENNATNINNIVHPAVKQDFIDWTKRQDAPIVAQECALLFESGFSSTIDFTIEVYAPKHIRLERAMQRDHATKEQIEERMARQMEEEEKRSRADFCIVNDGKKDVNIQIKEILQILQHQ